MRMSCRLTVPVFAVAVLVAATSFAQPPEPSGPPPAAKGWKATTVAEGSSLLLISWAVNRASTAQASPSDSVFQFPGTSGGAGQMSAFKARSFARRADPCNVDEPGADGQSRHADRSAASRRRMIAAASRAQRS